MAKSWELLQDAYITGVGFRGIAMIAHIGSSTSDRQPITKTKLMETTEDASLTVKLAISRVTFTGTDYTLVTNDSQHQSHWTHDHEIRSFALPLCDLVAAPWLVLLFGSD